MSLIDDDTKESENESGMDEEAVQIVFDANGGLFDNQEQTVTFNVLKGTPLSVIEAEPVRAGYEFGGWFLDSEFTKAADPNEFVVTENAVLFAKWQEAADLDKESILMAAEAGIYLVVYADNTKVGNATVTIVGKGAYGGTKTVKFKVLARRFK